MSSVDVVGPDSPKPLEEEQLPGGLAGLYHRAWLNLRTGNLGPAPIILGEVLVVILDEPTAALGVAQTRQVLELVRRLGEQGLAVVIISHNLHDIFETANRITVLRLGRNVGLFEREKTTQQEVVEAITAGKPTKVSGIPSTAPTGAAS